jgi:tetratricopeptide (TPR) repeat protein
MAYCFRGLAKTKCKGSSGAIEDFSKAIKIDPNYAEAYYCRGLFEIQSGQRNAGCCDLRKSNELGSDDAYEALTLYCR